MKNGGGYGGGGAGQGYELDIAEIMFLVFSGIFVLFYFKDANFKYFINSFYLFIEYAFKFYPAVIILYAFNVLFFLIGLHSAYVRIFETRVSGSKLKMYNKLERYRDKQNN
jgi:predicted membrane protein